MRAPKPRTAILAAVAAIGLGAAGVALVGSDRAHDLLINVRGRLFSSPVDSAGFEASPQDLRARGFLTDTPSRIERWRALVEGQTRLGPDLRRIAAIDDVMHRAEQLALLFTVYGATDLCGGNRSLMEKVVLPGCCTDQTQVFLAMAPLVDLDARETSFGSHAVVEIYERTRRHWALVDVQLVTRFNDGAGSPLSALDLARASRSGAPVVLDFFGRHDLSPHWTSARNALYRPSELIHFTVTNGSNVLAEDDLYRHLRFMSVPLQRIAGYLLRVAPHYLTVGD